MSANGANFRSLGANYDVTAVTAFPNLYFALSEYLSSFYIFQQSSVALFMMTFDFANSTEFSSQFREAFSFSGLGKAFVHVGPFVVFAFSSSQQVSRSIAQAAQLFEESEKAALGRYDSLINRRNSLEPKEGQAK